MRPRDSGEHQWEMPVKPADSEIRKFATRTDLIVGVITALILIVVTSWLVILLF